MLARTPPGTCLECGLGFDAAGFQWHHGRKVDGPAYWSDRGLLCSAPCAQAHFKRRMADGTFSPIPAEPPAGFED